MEQTSLKSRKPPANGFRQQTLTSWQPIMTPFKVVVVLAAIGVAFIPTGTTLIKKSNAVYEQKITYDGTEVDQDCSISSSNQGKVCSLKFTFDQDVSEGISVYYELDNFFQNHRMYVNSRYASQLQGQIIDAAILASSCDPMTKNGSLLLNPCGLIANSFFTDTYSLVSAPSSKSLDETGISWKSDRDAKFIQPTGFAYQKVSSLSVTCASVGLPTSCKGYYDSSSGNYYLYYYPNDATTQYLHESYPDQISPIKGVTDEHFIVWMRTAALSQFRKLYGRIDGPFSKGQTLVFNVTANYEVGSFDATKSLVISTVGEFGGKNDALGISYVVVGTLSLFSSFVFALKQLIAPRPLGDPKLLHWDQ